MAELTAEQQLEEERIRRAGATLFGIKVPQPVEVSEAATSTPPAEPTDDDRRTEAFMRQHGRRSPGL